MLLDVRTILVLFHPDNKQILLLKRSPHKKLFPNLVTGIGGKVELEQGEGEDIQQAALRELEEETRIRSQDLVEMRLRLSTLLTRQDQQVLLFWFTAYLRDIPIDLYCNEGTLDFYDIEQLPLTYMVPTARAAIPFLLTLSPDDPTVYNGIFDPETMRLSTNR